MYHPVGIQQLSKAQVRKLLTGGRVRVKAGDALKVSMVQEHAKKLASAAKKGAGIMLQLDPYACDMNREHLEGAGVEKQIKSAFKKAGKFVKGNKEAFRPLATHLKQQAHQGIADASMAALDYGVDPTLAAAYAQLAHQSVPTGGSLKSFSKGLSKFVKTPAVKTVRRALKPIGSMALRDANILAEAALQQGMDQAMQSMMAPTGGSLKSFSKGLSKFVKTPAVKTVRRALKPIGSMALRDANILAEAALQQGMDQALGSMSAPSGMGVASRAKQIARARAGGALFPAGY
jgi:hypothetical protein